MIIKKILAGISAVAAVFVFAVAVYAADSTVVVTGNDLEDSKLAAMTNDKWFFYNDETDNIDNSLGSFVIGPETAPEGSGSVQISVNGTQRRNLATYQFSGTPLEDITMLAYSTYNPSAGNGGNTDRSGYLQFNVSFDGSDTWQRRLTYLPSQNGTIVPDEWQEWDAIDDGDALWSWSGGSTWPDGYIGTYRTWSSILTAFPNAQIRDTDSFLGIRVGEPYANGYTENIDAFKFGTANGVTTYDFEPVLKPVSKDECKNGGWMTFNSPTFSNQGQCVSYVQANEKQEDETSFSLK